MEIRQHLLPNGVAVVQPVGRIDLTSAVEFREYLTKLMAEGRSRLVIDLAEVLFLDSTGLGALTSSLKAARLLGGYLLLSRPREQAKAVLELAALDRVFKVYSSVEEALADS